MKTTITKLSIASIAFFPALAFAQQKDLSYLVTLLIKYFNVAVYLTIGLATVMFVWNIFKYFIKGGDDVGAKKEAGQYVLWSVVGFFVILSFWGIVNILTSTFKLDSNAPSGFFGTFGGSGGSNSSPFSSGVTNNGSSGVTNNGSSGVTNNGSSGITNPSSGGESKGFLRTLWGIVY